MKVARLHPWPRTPKSAIALQRRLADQVRLTPIADDVSLLAGIDAALSRNGTQLVAGIVVWDLARRVVIETRIARVACRFPYVPGLLSFRETPGVLAAARKLRRTPDVFLCDAQGLAHPRRFGLACHVGLWLGVPTVGCAKSRLCGTHGQPAARRGSTAAVLDEKSGERIGTVVRTRDGVRPIYVSPGHLCDHESAVRIALAAAIRYRLPEPARLAHQLVTREADGPAHRVAPSA